MFPMNRQLSPVLVEYDCRGQRVRRYFADAVVAKRFYCAKAKAGKRPRVLAPSATTQVRKSK